MRLQANRCEEEVSGRLYVLRFAVRGCCDGPLTLTRLRVGGDYRPVTRGVCCMLTSLLLALAAVGGTASGELGSRLVGARLSLDGLAGVRPGMTPSQVRAAWRVPIVLSRSKSIPPVRPCRMASIAIGPVRGYALFEAGHLGAVFFTAGVRTDRGIGVGSTLKMLTATYGASRLLFSPAPNRTGVHVYTKARYGGDKRALRFDPDPKTGRLTQIGMGSIDGALGISTGRC